MGPRSHTGGCIAHSTLRAARPPGNTSQLHRRNGVGGEVNLTGDTDCALGRTKAEYRRLIEQAELLRPLTERMLRAADPAAAVRRIAEKVRPGGIVAFTDGWQESRRRPHGSTGSRVSAAAYRRDTRSR